MKCIVALEWNADEAERGGVEIFLKIILEIFLMLGIKIPKMKIIEMFFDEVILKIGIIIGDDE